MALLMALQPLSATRCGWSAALVAAGLLAVTAGCQSSRPNKPLDMLPAAKFEEKPRPKAVAAPRGETGGLLSTAANPPKRTGEEESSVDFPTPPAPKDAIPTPPKAELPPAPIMPVTATPPPLPPAPTANARPMPANDPAAPATLGLPTATPTVPIDAPPNPVNKTSLDRGVSVIPNNAPSNPSSAPPSGTIPGNLPTGVSVIGGSTVPPVAPPPPVAAPPMIEVKSAPRVEAGDLSANLHRLSDRAQRSYAPLDTYTLRMRRREMVSGRMRPEEVILAKFRREPFSIALKWIGEEGKGREVVYVAGQHDDKLHTLLAPTDAFLWPGKTMKLALDHPLLKSNCRYPVTDAGLGTIIARFERVVKATDAGDSREGVVKHLGLVKRAEFDEPVECVQQTMPARYDTHFQHGGQRFWYFEPKSGLPTLLITQDEHGREVEYYFHDRIQGPANLDDDDFNPNRLWKVAAK